MNEALQTAVRNVQLARETPEREERLHRRDARVLHSREQRQMTATEEDKKQRLYNVSVKLDGREGILIDTGAPGNICGDILVDCTAHRCSQDWKANDPRHQAATSQYQWSWERQPSLPV